jgi:DNA-directed RNA polymerase subunit RPC12/RpoP
MGAKWRIIYGLLWFMTLIAYSLPWAKVNDEIYSGWSFTVPFSFTYVIGILLGLIVLIIKFKPIIMTIIAGILMFLGVIGGAFGYAIGAMFSGLVGAKATMEGGMGIAFLFTIIYMIGGALAGKKMIVKSTKSQVKTSGESIRCQKCGSGNIVAYMGEYECMDCGYKFTQIPKSIEAFKPSISKTERSNKGSLAKWIIVIIIIFFSGLFLGYGIGASPKEVKTITITSILTPTGLEVTKPYTTTIIQPSILTTTYISIQTITTTMPYTPTQTLKEEKFYYMLGEKIEVDNWEIIINEVKRADNIIILDTSDPTYGTLYKPKKENYDFFIVNISIKNIGKKAESISDIWNYSIITIEEYVYEKISTLDMNDIGYGKIDEISKKYPEYPIINELNIFKTLDPEEKYNAWIIFTLPKDKIAKEITFNVGIFLGKLIHIKL